MKTTRGAVITTLCLVWCVVTACTASTSPARPGGPVTTGVADGLPMVVHTVRVAECQPRNVPCEYRYEIFADGRWTTRIDDVDDSGRLPASTTAQLVDTITAEIDTLDDLERHARGCPRTMDGSDVEFVFGVPDGSGGVARSVRVSNCNRALDEQNPLIARATQVIDSLEPAMPTTTAPAEPTDDASELPIVTLTRTGGMCPTGPCSSRLDIHRDGRWVRVQSGDRTAGRLTEESLRRLTAIVDEEIDTLSTFETHDPYCPSEYDGTDVTYTFRVLDDDGAVIEESVVSNCDVDIDGTNPLIAEVAEIARQLD